MISKYKHFKIELKVRFENISILIKEMNFPYILNLSKNISLATFGIYGTSRRQKDVFLNGINCQVLTGCPTYFPPFSKGYNLANNWLRSKNFACECDLWAAILFETKKFFWKFWKNYTASKKRSKMALLVKSTSI